MKKLILVFILISVFVCAQTAADEGICSWYTRESCLREGCSGIMANGRVMENDKLTCASWNYKMGSRVKITNVENNKYVIATVTDRGPSKRLKGRIIDLSRNAFMKISKLNKGLCRVRVEEV